MTTTSYEIIRPGIQTPIDGPPIVARCNCCGRLHSAVSWVDLERVGLQDALDGEWLELRNCACGSTIACKIIFTLTRRS